MYYYLIEHTSNWSERKVQDKLRRLSGQYGIAGETVTPSPARTIDELVAIGLEKNYSTFVGVGSDLFLNKIVSSVINQRGNYSAARLVAGLVPTNFSSDVAKWLGFKSAEQAAAALKTRKISPTSVGLIEPSKFFIAPLHINIKKPFTLKIETPHYAFTTQATALRIGPNLHLNITGVPGPGALLKGLKHFFTGARDENINDSLIRSDRIHIDTLDSLPVTLGSEVVVKTPMTVRVAPRSLNIIIEKGTLE